MALDEAGGELNRTNPNRLNLLVKKSLPPQLTDFRSGPDRVPSRLELQAIPNSVKRSNRSIACRPIDRRIR